MLNYIPKEISENQLLGNSMAIKVISRRHPSAVKQVICKNCGAELEYTDADTKKTVVSDYLGDKETFRSISCPECNKTISVK